MIYNVSRETLNLQQKSCYNCDRPFPLSPPTLINLDVYAVTDWIFCLLYPENKLSFCLNYCDKRVFLWSRNRCYLHCIFSVRRLSKATTNINFRSQSWTPVQISGVLSKSFPGATRNTFSRHVIQWRRQDLVRRGTNLSAENQTQKASIRWRMGSGYPLPDRL